MPWPWGPQPFSCLQALERLKLRAVEVANHPHNGIPFDPLEAVHQGARIKACWFMPKVQNP
jgi:DNA-binding transcriptional MocR family regulator